MPPKDKYTDPKLRDEIKEELKAGDKGGEPGQWSARKAQMMAKEYKKRGGGYNDDKSNQDESQKHLEKWTEEEWQTKDGSGNAKKEDGTQKRYLPKEAWKNMTEEEKEATDQKKQEGSKEGKQHVGNTSKAKQSRKEANEKEDERFEAKKVEKPKQKGKKRNAKKGDDVDGEEEEEEEEEEANGDSAKDAPKNGGSAYDNDDGDHDGDNDEKAAKDNEEGEEAEETTRNKKATAGQKRKATTSQASANKQQKTSSNKSGSSNAPSGTTGSKHMPDEAPAPRGSTDRLPKKGQKATWKAMPGFVDGTVTEVLTSGKKVDGKDVKASEKDPKIVLKSTSSGKICVHKPDACFYD